MRASRYEPTLNETCADLLNPYGTHGLPARVRRPRDKALAESTSSWFSVGVSPRCGGASSTTSKRSTRRSPTWLTRRPYSDGSGKCRRTRFEAIDRPHMHPLPARRWQPTVWHKNKVHRDDHISIDRHNDSVPFQYIGNEVDVCLRGELIEVFHKGGQITVHTRSCLNNHTPTLKQPQPLGTPARGRRGNLRMDRARSPRARNPRARLHGRGHGPLREARALHPHLSRGPPPRRALRPGSPGPSLPICHRWGLDVVGVLQPRSPSSSTGSACFADIGREGSSSSALTPTPRPTRSGSVCTHPGISVALKCNPPQIRTAPSIA